MEYRVHGLHRRGRQNFCLQKSRMSLAGLVYFNFNLGWFEFRLAMQFGTCTNSTSFHRIKWYTCCTLFVMPFLEIKE